MGGAWYDDDDGGDDDDDGVEGSLRPLLMLLLLLGRSVTAFTRTTKNEWKHVATSASVRVRQLMGCVEEHILPYVLPKDLCD
jgi:hypothetical protein